MTYVAVEPDSELRPFVETETLWLQENPCQLTGAPPTRIVPGGGVELVICYGAPFEQVDSGPTRTMPMALVSGQRLSRFSVRATGQTGMVIARCYPWAARALLGTIVPKELVDRYTALDEVKTPPEKAARERLPTCARARLAETVRTRSR